MINNRNLVQANADQKLDHKIRKIILNSNRETEKREIMSLLPSMYPKEAQKIELRWQPDMAAECAELRIYYTGSICLVGNLV